MLIRETQFQIPSGGGFTFPSQYCNEFKNASRNLLFNKPVWCDTVIADEFHKINSSYQVLDINL